MTLVPADDIEQARVSPERLANDIDAETLRQYFTLTPPDLDQVHQSTLAKTSFTPVRK